MAKRLTDFRVFQRALQCPSAVADGARRIVDAPQRNAVKRGLESAIEFSDQLPGFNESLVESKLSFVTADMTEQADNSLHFESRRTSGYEKGRYSAFAR